MNRFERMWVALAMLALSVACTKPVNVEQERAALMSADRQWPMLEPVIRPTTELRAMKFRCRQECR